LDLNGNRWTTGFVIAKAVSCAEPEPLGKKVVGLRRVCEQGRATRPELVDDGLELASPVGHRCRDRRWRALSTDHACLF
jgi:hypothetical protein